MRSSCAGLMIEVRLSENEDSSLLAKFEDCRFALQIRMQSQSAAGAIQYRGWPLLVLSSRSAEPSLVQFQEQAGRPVSPCCSKDDGDDDLPQATCGL